MSNAYVLQALQYEPEAAWGEDVATFATHRFPLVGTVDTVSLKHDKIDPQKINQYLQDGQPHILGPMGGTLTTTIYATGHGSSTSGAVTVDALETILSYVFSGAGASGAGGTVTVASGTTATGGTATVPLTASASGFPAGGMCRIGAQNDARGKGQAYAISSHAANALTLLTGMAAPPNNGDVVYGGSLLYLPESPVNCNVTSIRCLVLAANLRYELHGVYPMSIALTGFNPGERPTWKITWGISWWRHSTAAFPSSVTANQYNPAPSAGGTLFVNDVGTATRVERVAKQLELAIKLGVVAIEASGGVNSYQKCVGARRTPTDYRIRWIEDADANTATPVLDGFFTGTTSKHVLWTHSSVNGASVSFYAPNCRVVGARPVQRNYQNVNSLQIELEANASATTTSELTTSAVRFFYS